MAQNKPSLKDGEQRRMINTSRNLNITICSSLASLLDWQRQVRERETKAWFFCLSITSGNERIRHRIVESKREQDWG